MTILMILMMMVMMMMMMTSDNIGCHGEDDVARGPLCVRFELLDEGFENYQQNSLLKVSNPLPPSQPCWLSAHVFICSFIRLFVITILMGEKGPNSQNQRRSSNFLT